MKIICNEKWGDEWLHARGQRITSSGIAAALAAPGTQVKADYAAQLLADLQNIPNHMNEQPDRWAVDARGMHERAVGWYANETGTAPMAHGFIVHDNYEWLGFTPDGIIEPDGLVHVHYRKSIKAVRKNSNCTGADMKRVQFELLCSGLRWCDYVNYWEDGKNHIGTIQRVFFDAEVADAVEYACHLFWNEILTAHFDNIDLDKREQDNE